MKPVAKIRGRGRISRRNTKNGADMVRLLKGYGVCVRVYGLSKVAREGRWLKGLVERGRAQGREKRQESRERSWSRDKSCVCDGRKESQRKRRGFRGASSETIFFFSRIYFMKL